MGDLNQMYEIIKDKHELYNVLIKSIMFDFNYSVSFEDAEIMLENILLIYNKKNTLKMDDDKNICLIKELVQKAKTPLELLETIEGLNLTTEMEKKQNAEISTPYELRKEMLDKMPHEFWENPTHKVFEPCCGKGWFVMDIFLRFDNCLKEVIPDDVERRRHIVEHNLYFADINPFNIYICKLLLSKYSMQPNYYEGNTLKMDIKEEWDLEGFDAVIGNPPYNDASGNKGKSHTLWDKFVLFSLNKLNNNGYLLFVHPNLWRQVNNSILKEIKKYQLHYLEIHNSADGQKTFRCATCYDWYLLEKMPNYNSTIVKDEDGKINTIDLNDWEFIPNKCFDEIKTLINNDEEKLNTVRDRSIYGTEKKKLVVKTKKNDYIYPLVNSINKKNQLSLRYTNDNTKGQFGKSKFIFSNGSGFYCDKTGEYGFTEWGYCIYDESDVLENIEKAFKTEKFKKIKEAIHLGSQSYNIPIMKLFKKDFWKEFI